MVFNMSIPSQPDNPRTVNSDNIPRVASETSGILPQSWIFTPPQIQISFQNTLNYRVWRLCVCVCESSHCDLSKAKKHKRKQNDKANLSAFRQLCIIILRHIPWPPSVCSMLHAMKNDDVVPCSWRVAEAMGAETPNFINFVKKHWEGA